jgi:hypothetical protein
MIMRKTVLAALCLAAVGIPVIGPTFVLAQSYEAYQKIKGTKQGQFKGQTSPSSPKPTGTVNTISPAVNPTLQGNALGKGDSRGGSPPSAGWDLKANKKF